MTSLFKLEKNFINASKRYYQKQDELRKQKEAIEKKISDMDYPHFIGYLKKLGKACLPKIKGATNFQVMGPFGLGNETSLWFHKNNSTEVDDIVASATFTRYGDGYALKNYSKNTGEFAKNTIGELNGMNYESIEITPEMTIDWFIKFTTKKEKKKK